MHMIGEVGLKLKTPTLLLFPKFFDSDSSLNFKP